MNTLRQQISLFPHKPGCYLFKDTTGLVLYVGKAKDLRKRVAQYFGQDKRPQLPFLIDEAHNIDYIVARTELEALFLENTLIKKHNPKYNIKLKDDKNYAFISIDYSTEIPQIGYARKITDSADFTPFLNPSASWGSGKTRVKGIGYRTQSNTKHSGLLHPTPYTLHPASYFGPYSSVKKIRETLDFVRHIFPYCANTEVSSRPCFYFHLHRCPGVCVGAVSLDEYQKNLDRIKLFLNGKTTQVKKELKISMVQAAKRKRFELAARLRDQTKALDLLDERQVAQFPKKVSYDFVSLATMGNLECINLFKVRDGKLTDKENFIYTAKQLLQVTNYPLDRKEPKTGRQKIETNLVSQIIQTFVETYYADTTDVPNAVFTQYPVTETELIGELLRHKKNKKVSLSVPRRGKAKQLIKLGTINAEEYLRKTLATDATDVDKLHEALATLQKVLKLKTIPKRIECYDMSNTQGSNPVGSMVVFIDGKPAKSEYRKFKIRSKNTPDDFAMMRETLTRRLQHLPETVKSDSKAWDKPDLIVIDGGKGQLSAALAALKGAQVESEKLKVKSENVKMDIISTPYTLYPIPCIGLAKRIEEIFIPHKSQPIILSHADPALQMLQRLRDEAHRFGITFHRSLRSKQSTKSALDTISGIGPKTKKLLKQKFGTVSNIKKIALEETEKLEELVGKAKAKIIRNHL